MVVSSLHLNNVPVKYASAGQIVTLKLQSHTQIQLQEQSSLSSATESYLHNSTVANSYNSSSYNYCCQDNNYNSNSYNNSSNNSGTIARKRITAAGLVLLPLSYSVSVPPTTVAGNTTVVDATIATATATAYWEFEAEVLLLNHPSSKIRINYEPVVHIGCVQQSARLLAMYTTTATKPNLVTSSTEYCISSSSVTVEPVLPSCGNIEDDESKVVKLPVVELLIGERAICR